jgi:hypothetical protein
MLRFLGQTFFWLKSQDFDAEEGRTVPAESDEAHNAYFVLFTY